MSALKTSPGPWSLIQSETHPNDPITICDANDIDLAEVFSHEQSMVSTTPEQALGNARLMAAAPELLEALQALYAAAGEWQPFSVKPGSKLDEVRRLINAHDAARAALNKARGASS